MHASEKNRSQVIEQKKEKAMNSLKRVEIARERRKTEKEKLAEAIAKIKPLSISGVNRVQEMSKASAEKAINAIKETLIPGALTDAVEAIAQSTLAEQQAQANEWVNILDYNLDSDPTTTLVESRVVHNLLNANITNQVLVKLLISLPEMDVFLLIMLRLFLPQQRSATFPHIKHMIPHLKRIIISQLSNGTNIRLCLLLAYVAKMRIEPDFLLDCIGDSEMTNSLVYKLILGNSEYLARGVEEEYLEKLALSAVEIRRKDVMVDFLTLVNRALAQNLPVPVGEIFQRTRPYMFFDTKIVALMSKLLRKADSQARELTRSCMAPELFRLLDPEAEVEGT